MGRPASARAAGILTGDRHTGQRTGVPAAIPSDSIGSPHAAQWKTTSMRLLHEPNPVSGRNWFCRLHGLDSVNCLGYVRVPDRDSPMLALTIGDGHGIAGHGRPTPNTVNSKTSGGYRAWMTILATATSVESSRSCRCVVTTFCVVWRTIWRTRTLNRDLCSESVPKMIDASRGIQKRLSGNPQRLRCLVG